MRSRIRIWLFFRVSSLLPGRGVSWSGFEAGDKVALFGVGPVGLLTAYSAILRGPARVYSIDCVEDRLELAASIGAIPINFIKGEPSA